MKIDKQKNDKKFNIFQAYKNYKLGGGNPNTDNGFMNIPDGLEEELPFN